jgi:hypothetical protein
MNKGGANGEHCVPVIDRYLSMLAPFFGDVVCVTTDKPQGAYRMHGDNAHVISASFEHYADTSIEPFECARYVNQLLSRLKIAHQPIDVQYDENVMRRQLVCQRLKLEPRHCSTLLEALWKYWRSVLLRDAPIRTKLKWYMWSLVAVAGPRPVTLWAVRARDKRWVGFRRGDLLDGRVFASR